MNKLHGKLFPISAVKVMRRGLESAQSGLIRCDKSKLSDHLYVAVLYKHELDAMIVARAFAFDRVTEAERIVGWLEMGAYDFCSLLRSTESVAQIPSTISFPGESVYVFFDGSVAAFHRKTLTIRVVS